MFRVTKRQERMYTTKTFRFSTKLLEEVEKIAKKNDVSSNELVRQCIEYALGNMGRGEIDE